MFRKKEGFTLIELLVVIAIIAILASIALLSLAPAQKAGRDTRRIADLRNMQSVLQIYYNKCGFYPGPAATTQPCPTPGGTTPLVSGTCYTWKGNPAATGCTNAANSNLADILANSISIASSSIPGDPLPTQNYLYGVSANYDGYALKAALETDHQVLNSSPKDSQYGINCTPSPTNVRAYCVQF